MSFMARALPYLKKTKEARPGPFAEPPYEGSIAAAVVNRDGVVARDNGQCNGVFEIDFFPDRLPQRTARCRPNEVEVPTVMGTRLATARQRLAAQPLTPRVVWQTAE